MPGAQSGRISRGHVAELALVQGDQIGADRRATLAQSDSAVIRVGGPNETCFVEGRPPVGCLAELASGLDRAHSNANARGLRLVVVTVIAALDPSLQCGAKPVVDRVGLPVCKPAERMVAGAVTTN